MAWFENVLYHQKRCCSEFYVLILSGVNPDESYEAEDEAR